MIIQEERHRDITRTREALAEVIAFVAQTGQISRATYLKGRTRQGLALIVVELGMVLRSVFN